MEGICACARPLARDGGVIRRDYKLMNMHHFSTAKSRGAEALGVQFASFLAQAAASSWGFALSGLTVTSPACGDANCHVTVFFP